MPTHQVTCVPDANSSASVVPDRRKRRRFNLQYSVTLILPDHESIRTHTVNVSSDGFFCYCSTSLSIGQIVTALIEIPEDSRDAGCQVLILCCEAEVLRAETQPGASGVACRIRNYSVGQDVKAGSDAIFGFRNAPSAHATQ